MLEDEGTVVGCAGESAEESVELLGLGCDVSFGWLASRSVLGLGGDFICPSGSGSRLLSLQREGHGGEAGLVAPSGPGASLCCWTVGWRLLGARAGSTPGDSSHPTCTQHTCTCGPMFIHKCMCTRTHERTHRGPTSQGWGLPMVGSEGSGGPTAPAAEVTSARLWARVCRTGSREHRRERRTVKRGTQSVRCQQPRCQAEASQSQEWEGRSEGE